MKAALPAIAAHARDAYPAECCGLLLQDAQGAFRFAPIENVAGSLKGQETSSRSQHDGYVMDSKALLATLEENERLGGTLYAIVHSHPDVGAYFSKEDRDMALGGADEPLWPGVRYLVVSVRKGIIDAARLYTWDGAHHNFMEEEVSGITAY